MGSTNNSTSPNLAIIGGGIAGLALAIGLQRHGVPFHIYESAHSFGEIGAGLGLNQASQLAMKLIDPALYEGFKTHATHNDSMPDTWYLVHWGMDSKTRTADGYGPKAGDLLANIDAPGAGVSSVHRAHFLDELVKLVPKDCVTFGKRVLDVIDQGDSVRIDFKDGTSATHSAAIGCDGIKSQTRTSLLGKEYGPVFSGKYCYRGTVPMDVAAAALGDKMARNSYFHVGYGGHLLHMPIDNGATMNVVAFASKEGDWTDPTWIAEATKEDLLRDFDGWGDATTKILNLMQSQSRWALFNDPPAPTYYKNRVALLGDAAHATTPHMGSGAGMAIEDAYIMSCLLGLARASGDDMPVAFSVYDELRRIRSQRLVTRSKRMGMFWELEAPGIGDDPEKFRANAENQFSWVWEHDLEKELEYGKQLLKERMHRAV